MRNKKYTIILSIITVIESIFVLAIPYFTNELVDYSLAKDKNNVDALALMAQILYDQDQKDISLLFTKKALAVDKTNEKVNELEVLLSGKSPKKEDIVLDSLDDVDTLYEEAYDLYNQGDLETASEILEKILDFDDGNSEALALMGLIYYHSGIFPKAVEYYRKAVKINKNGEMVNQLKMRVS